MSEHWLDKALEEMETMVPDKGFNVVGVDKFALAGEALYLVLHTEDREEAEKTAKEHAKRSGNACHVYEAGDLK